VSVVVPAYNAGSFIAETLDSVLAQTYRDFEIIVVNDGSTDDTEQVLAGYGNSIRVIDQENGGSPRARNFGIEQADGDWIAFVDADDLWTPDKLQVQLAGLEGQRWSHTNSFYVGSNQGGSVSRSDLTPQYGGQVFDKLIVNNFITTSTVIIEKRLLSTLGGFDESLLLLQDWALWIEIAKTEALHYEPRCLAHYRIHPKARSRNAQRLLPYHLRLIDSVFDGIPSADPRARLKAKALAESYAVCSYIAEDANEFSFSAYCALKAAQNEVTRISRWKRVLRTASNLVQRPRGLHEARKSLES
jgi:glycosyltransferase involved in cell wall biosynthesis